MLTVNSADDPTQVAEAALAEWYPALQSRYLAELQFAEVRRALEALSGLYVKRRSRLREGHGLDTAGKRAAFALFYGPLHFLQVHRVVHETGLGGIPFKEVVDLGCGTGFSGVGWAHAASCLPELRAYDANRWAVAECRWTQALGGCRGSAAVADMTRVRLGGEGQAILAAFALNELDDEVRQRMQSKLALAVKRGASALIIEPIARRVAPWLREWQKDFARFTVRYGEWRITPALPEPLRLLDKAAGLDHRQLTCQSLLIKAGDG